MNIIDSITDLTNTAFHNAQGAVRGNSAGDPPGFTNLAALPPAGGSQVRQAQIPNSRLATATRNMVRWFLPELGIVEMYVNPQNINYTNAKHIGAPVRTRGGYMVQYWGEELGKISINGTTGSSNTPGDAMLRTNKRPVRYSVQYSFLPSGEIPMPLVGTIERTSRFTVCRSCETK